MASVPYGPASKAEVTRGAGIVALAGLEHPGHVNLSNPTELTVRRISEDLLRVAEGTSRLEYVMRPVEDPQRRGPDITLAGEVLAWQPKVAWLDGLTGTVAWFQRQVPDAAATPDGATPRAGRVMDGGGVPR